MAGWKSNSKFLFARALICCLREEPLEEKELDNTMTKYPGPKEVNAACAMHAMRTPEEGLAS